MRNFFPQQCQTILLLHNLLALYTYIHPRYIHTITVFIEVSIFFLRQCSTYRSNSEAKSGGEREMIDHFVR